MVGDCIRRRFRSATKGMGGTARGCSRFTIACIRREGSESIPRQLTTVIPGFRLRLSSRGHGVEDTMYLYPEGAHCLIPQPALILASPGVH